MSQSAEKDVPVCCVCGDTAVRTIATRGLIATGQTLYCDRDAAEVLARATRVTPPERTER